MRSPLTFVCLGAALAGLACIVPPALYERASLGPPPESWQRDGRYRQSIVAEPAPTPTVEAPVAPARRFETSTDPHATEIAQPAPQLGAQPAPEPPLYAWDGGVIDGAPQGRVSEQGGTPRGLEPPPAGRTHIIELYQQVLDERDALATEVELLRKGLAETRIALDAKSKEAQDLTARLAALEAAHAGLLSDNQDIAARLVQAQIRRLEAEKLLLETRIEVERAKAEEAAQAAAELKAGPAKKGAKPAEPKPAHGEEHD
jgi:hypothetical protein